MDSLVSRAWLALEQTGSHRLVVCGGVAANGHLRRVLQDRAAAAGTELFLPPLTSAATTPPWWPPWVTTCSRPASAWTWTRTSSPGGSP